MLHFAGACLIACLVALMLAVSPAVAAPAARASARVPDQKAVAKRLVTAVTKARTPRARQQALLSLMRELDIAVVTVAGKPLVTTPEPNFARRFQVYDVELRALAAQLARRETTTFADVAATLTRAGLVLAPGKPFPADLLSESVAEAVKDALRRPRSERSLLPLVVRQLGLARGSDLRRPAAAAGARLDALQSWLIAADVMLPVLRKVPAASGRASSVTAAGAQRARAAATSDECARFTKAAEKLEERLGKDGAVKKWVADEAIGKIGDKVGDKLKREGTRWAIRNLPRWAVRAAWRAGQAVAAGVIDGLHGSLLAFSVDVRALKESLAPTHWLHQTGASGGELTFSVQVTMRDDLGETAAKCGKLAGYDIPEKGGVPDVWIGWEQAQNALDPAHGKLECPMRLSGLCASKTDGGGVARVVFKPRKEALPGVGMEQEKTGVVNGVAAYQGLGDNVLGTVAQFLTPKYGGMRWFVRFHNPRGYKISYRSPRICGSFGNDGCVGWDFVWEYELRVCGPEAYGVPWKGKQVYTEYDRNTGEQTSRWEEPMEISFQPGQTTTWHEPGDEGDRDRRTDFTIFESDRSTMRVDLHRANAFQRDDPAFSEYRDTQDVRIQEDTTCPPLPEL